MSDSGTIERSIVVPVFNGMTFLPEFWHHLISNVPPKTEIIIVDDGSIEPVHYTFPKDSEYFFTRVLRNNTNIGYAATVNRGATHASGRFLHVLNTDVFVEGDPFSATENALTNDSDLGIIGIPLLYPQSNRFQHFGVGFAERRKHHVFRHCPRSLAPKPEFSDLQAVTFAFATMAAQTWRDLGGLDETFYNRNEDIDFCLRLKQRGRRIAVAGDVHAYHWESISGPARFALDGENEAHFWGRWLPGLRADIAIYLRIAVQAALERRAGRELGRADYRLVNLTRGSVDPAFDAMLRETLPLSDDDVVRQQRFTDRRAIHLSMVLPFGLAMQSRPFVYLVDEWPMLSENAHWYSTRKEIVPSEIVVDLNANVLWTDEVYSYD